MDILKSLEECSAVSSYEIDQYRSWANGRYYKLVVSFRDNSTLFAREYVDQTERCYSFHWQDENKNLLRRWDNAPHHPNLDTHPHHCHRGEKLPESAPTNLKEVLAFIEVRGKH